MKKQSNFTKRKTRIYNKGNVFIVNLALIEQYLHSFILHKCLLKIVISILGGEGKTIRAKSLSIIKKSIGHFPGGPVVKNPPSNSGDTGLIPGQGTKIPHAAGQLSPRALEPACHS